VKIPKLRWVIAGMLFLATAVNYADRLALSLVTVAADFQREVQLNDVDYSWVVAAFFLAYAIMYAGSGYIVDRLGTRRGFAFFVGFWSFAAMLHAFAWNAWSFGFCRFLLGLGEPGNWPAAAKAVSEWFSAKHRALGVGIFNAGSSIGSALAPPAIWWLTSNFGWRAAFLGVGAIGLVWMIVWMFVYDPPHTNSLITAEEYDAIKDEVLPPDETKAASAEKVNWSHVVRTKACIAISLARAITDPVMYFVIFWLPKYLEKERHFDLAMVGKYSWVPFIFGGIGYLVGGWLSGYLMGRGWQILPARKCAMFIGAACLPVVIAATHVPTAALAIAATCFLTLGHGFWTANLQALPTDLFPGYEVGTVSGFSGMGGALVGMVANLGTGYVVSQFSYSPIFLVAGLMHPTGMLIIHLMLKPTRHSTDMQKPNRAHNIGASL
jgi:ACS family hexuronate transporter-like MFS transporter